MQKERQPIRQKAAKGPNAQQIINSFQGYMQIVIMHFVPGKGERATRQQNKLNKTEVTEAFELKILPGCPETTCDQSIASKHEFSQQCWHEDSIYCWATANLQVESHHALNSVLS